MKSRHLIVVCLAATLAHRFFFAPAAIGGEPPQHPNFILILADDLGYGDLGCFGATAIRTPNLDRLASEGMKLTSFYAQPVCGPSRGALMTGRYPNRIGGGWTVLTEEVTIPEVLGRQGYATACIGKWDMSARRYVAGQVPNDQGFQDYFGPLGANDSGKVTLWCNREMLRETDDMGSLTKLYTDEALQFIRQKKDAPFFLYLASTMPHVRIGASAEFLGKSQCGLYGDVVEELDWNIGRVIDLVKELGLEKKTYVVFTSDNGPWLSKGKMAGSASPLRGGKGSAWEGGFRVPCIVWAPGRVAARAVSNELACTLDVLPTFAALAGAPLPEGRVLDGRDQSSLITRKTDRSARDTFYYHVRGNLHAVRQGKWKLALADRKLFYDYALDNPPVTSPQLYDLEADVAEKHDVAADHPEIVRRLQELAKRAREDAGDLHEVTTKASTAPKPALQREPSASVGNDQRPEGGVFSLWSMTDDFSRAPELDVPSVAGLSARFAWSALEPQPGDYRWKSLDAARDLAAAKKKQLMVRVTAGMNSPSWVYERGCRRITFSPEDTNFMKPGTQPAMPVPWDEPYLAAWEQFLKSLGQHLRDWPELYCVQMTGGGFIGEMHLPKKSSSVVAQWQAAGISDEHLIAMWQRIIRAYDRSMPARVGVVLDLGQPFTKSQATPAVYAWARDHYPGRVWFQQNGLNERVTADGQYSKMLRAAAETTTVGYQMLGGGKFLDEQTGDRRKCFERALADGCRYVEVYRQDLHDPKWKSAVDDLAEGLRRSAGASLPPGSAKNAP